MLHGILQATSQTVGSQHRACWSAAGCENLRLLLNEFASLFTSPCYRNHKISQSPSNCLKWNLARTPSQIHTKKSHGMSYGCICWGPPFQISSGRQHPLAPCWGPELAFTQRGVSPTEPLTPLPAAQYHCAPHCWFRKGTVPLWTLQPTTCNTAFPHPVLHC